MGKFEGILICTDWDGTLFYNDGISEENIKAIKYFQANGGLFTICSGRYYEFLKQYEHLVRPNTYIACYNGALILDCDNMNKLYESFCDDYLFNIIDSLISSGIQVISINVYDDINSEPITYSPEEYNYLKNDLKKRNIYKALIRTDVSENGDRFSKYAKTLDLRDYIAVRSWKTGLEIMKLENSKGNAITRIASSIPCKLSIGVGNFENDIELIKAADIGYAVGDSPDEIKAIADRITVDASDSAIAKIIYEIEREYCS